MAQALAEAILEIEQNEQIRAVLLTGDGERFCAGGDASAMASSPSPASYVRELAGTLDSALQRLAATRKPVICAVQGAVAGAGIAVMLSCDLIVAAPQTKFVMAYSAIGLTPECGASWLLPRAVGQQRALELSLGGRSLSAQEALDWGLISRIAEDSLAHAREAAVTIATGPHAALGETRRLLRSAWSSTRAEAGAEETRTIAAAVGQDYARTALRRFHPDNRKVPS